MMEYSDRKMVTFRFYEELNDHLKHDLRKRDIPRYFNNGQTVKDAIEKLGVPHCEIDLILANGQSVDFNYHLNDGDFISVYPVFESFDISPVLRLRPEPLRIIKFVLDAHLGKLTRKLRLLGFDSLYQNNFADLKIIELAISEKRIILTRDRRMLMHKNVTHGYFLRNTDPRKQLSEVVKRFQLQNQMKPFARCCLCNGEIVETDKTSVFKILLEKTAKYYNEFFICNSCGQVYWKGSHWERLVKEMEGLRKYRVDIL
jgi:uncharacterized protein